MYQVSSVIVLFLLSLLLTACPASKSGVVYTRDEARQVQQVEMGTIQSVQPVQIEGTKSGIGSIGGAVVGGIAASTVGGGRGSAIASVLGAIAGGVAGAAVEEGTTRQTALEITVTLDSGRTLSLVQGADVEFKPGERVKVLTNGFESRVSR